MRIKYSAQPLQKLTVDNLVMLIPAFDRIVDPRLKALDAATRGGVRTMLTSEEFRGREGETATVLHPGGFRARRVRLAGVGEKSKLQPDAFRQAAGILSRQPALSSSRTVAFSLGDISDERFFQAVMEGYLLGGHQFGDFKTSAEKKEKSRLAEIIFVVANEADLKKIRPAVRQGLIIAEGQTLVRRLAFIPGNYLTPRLLAQKARQLARQYQFSCRVLDEKAIGREKMGALLGVAKGSKEPPRFIIVRHRGGKRGSKPIVLVGKGVTFDAGGISLKAPLNMHEMKGDMAGGAAVLATVTTAARLKLPLDIVGLIPAAENLPSGTATKPGDVLTSRKGLTIEIINTDAEGRLLLADALDFANTFKPQVVIDIATLTGASLYVLGYAGAPILGNNEQLLQRVKEASEATAEKVWALPIWDDHRELLKSPVADMVNSAGRPAGTIVASAFLENFIGDWPWAHIDIAYVDLEPKGKPYIPKGATGFGLRLLVEMLSRWQPLK